MPLYQGDERTFGLANKLLVLTFLHKGLLTVARLRSVIPLATVELCSVPARTRQLITPTGSSYPFYWGMRLLTIALCGDMVDYQVKRRSFGCRDLNESSAIHVLRRAGEQ
jgi:hypothetical protein